MLELISGSGPPRSGGPRTALTLALARPELIEERPTWGSAAANAVMLRLEPLPADDAVELVRQAGGGRIADEEAAEIAGRARAATRSSSSRPPACCSRRDGEHPPGSRTILPPPCRPSSRRASTRSRPGCATSRAAHRCSSYSFDLRRARRRGRRRPTSTSSASSRRPRSSCARTAAGGRARWRVRHATLREVAYASLPKRERLRLHERVADRLLAAGHPSWAADHLELAALASLDLDPQDRTAARARSRRAARRRRPRASPDGEPHGRRPLPAGARDRRAPRTAGACARRGRSPAWARRATGSASTRRRADALERAVDARRRSTTTRSRWRSRCGSSATSRSTSRPTSTRRRSCSTGRSPRPRSSASPWRSRGPCCSPAGCRGRAATTRRRRRCGGAPSRSPRTTTGGRGCARSHRSRSTAAA